MTSKVPREEYIERARLSQPENELRRKAQKARSKSNLWTQEEIDLGVAVGRRMASALKWE